MISGETWGDMPPERKTAIIKKLYATRNDGIPFSPKNTNGKLEVRYITEEELEQAAADIKIGKTPGLDGVPPETIKLTVQTNQQWILDVLNHLMDAQIFPRDWKVAKIVLLPKKRRDLEAPSSYRPLRLLNTLSKLYEAVIKMRLTY
ncbi:hypothetical protein QE152_g27467 [Popillia japonica]|uniref:Reverse transcriptase n=1 Tax=Popillia japonica TaxID=7064 RepID=A0AAW1JVC7_POPJA